MNRERKRVLELLRRHGYNTTSFQVLERGMRYWFDRSSPACVGYVDTGSAWVAAGAPIAPPEALSDVAMRFVDAATSSGKRVCFFAAQDRLVECSELSSMPVGAQPSWVPERWPENLQISRSLREQLRRARAKGVTVRMVTSEVLLDPDSGVRGAMEAVISSWLSARRMAPMGFLVAVQPFDFPEERRYFLAERGGRVVGFLVAVPIYARRGWLFEDFLRFDDAPNGSIELLFDAAIRQMAQEGAEMVTLGLAPLAGEVSPWLLTARSWFRAFYDFEGLLRFKVRLAPHRWERVHLAWPPGSEGIFAVYDALAAFTLRESTGRASFVRFGLETALGSFSVTAPAGRARDLGPAREHVRAPRRSWRSLSSR